MKKLIAFIIPILSLIVFSGCNSLTSTSSLKTKQTHLSFQTLPSSTVTPTTGASPAASGSGTTTSGSSSTVKIDTAEVLIRKIEFDGEHEDSTEFKAGPFIVDLNMDTTVTQLAVSNMPNGTYRGISFQIHKPGPNSTITDTDFVAGPKEDQRYSVVVKGFFNGKHFVFKSQREAEEHIHLNPPLIVSDTLNSYNATIQVNVNQWFVNQNGATLDPTNPANAEAIDRAIQRSFRGIKDNNEDGHEDGSKTKRENQDHSSNKSNHDGSNQGNG